MINLIYIFIYCAIVYRLEAKHDFTQAVTDRLLREYRQTYGELSQIGFDTLRRRLYHKISFQVNLVAAVALSHAHYGYTFDTLWAIIFIGCMRILIFNPLLNKRLFPDKSFWEYWWYLSSEGFEGYFVKEVNIRIREKVLISFRLEKIYYATFFAVSLCMICLIF